jgi:hypothetical protein
MSLVPAALAAVAARSGFCKLADTRQQKLGQVRQRITVEKIQRLSTPEGEGG